MTKQTQDQTQAQPQRGTVLVGSQIEGARLLALRQMLRLELLGMKRSGRSAYTILKEMGFTGTRQQVMAQLDEVRAALLGETQGESK